MERTGNIEPTIPDHKIRMPRVTERVERQTLSGYLAPRDGRRLMVVHARAGQGKTLFIADYLQNRRKSFSWYNLDRSDAEDTHLIRGLLASLSGADAARYARDLPTSPDELRLVLQRALRNRASRDHYIVLDDIHLLPAGTSGNAFLKTLVEEAPEGIHLVLVGRRYPDLELARLRAYKEVVEIDDEDLAFTADEVRALFQRIAKIPLPAATFDGLFDLVRGWVTGYIYLIERLAVLTREERDRFLEEFLKSGTLPEIEAYFTEEVINHLPEETAAILFQIGAVKHPTADLLSQLAPERGEELLMQLLRENAFLEVHDRTSHVYTVTPLFYRYLLGRFRKLDQKVRGRTIRLIADYYERKGFYRLLLWYLLMAEESNRARSVFERYSDELYRTLDRDEFRAVLEAFPESLREEPRFAYYYALSTSLVHPESTRLRFLELLPLFLKSREYGKVARIYATLLINSLFYLRSTESMVDTLERADAFLSEFGDRIATEEREILEVIVPLGKWWSGDDGDRAFQIALKAEETSFRFQNQEAYLCSRFVLSRMYFERGDFQEAKRLLHRTEMYLDTHRTSEFFSALAAFYLGDMYFYSGELNTAVDRIEQVLKQCPVDFAFRYYLELNLIIYNLYREDTTKAESLFEITENREIEENLYVRYFSRFLVQMLIAYRNRNHRRAEFFCERLLEEENRPLLRMDFPYSHLALAEVSLFLERYETVREILAPLVSPEFQSDHPYPAAGALGLQLVLLHRTGGVEEERERTRAAMVSLIEERGYHNLDIVDPEVLNLVAELACDSRFSSFPRLAGRWESSSRSVDEFDLVVKTLGPFRFFVHGKEIETAVLTSQKRVMDLLKLLVVYRHSGIMKEKVYEIFWPRYSYKSARDNLNTIIYRLRKLLGADSDFLVTEMNMIHFKAGKVRTDVDDFHELTDRARTAETEGNLELARSFLLKAKDLYGGDFLAEDLYLDFVREEREEMRNRYRHVLFTLSRISLSMGSYGTAIDWAKKIISLDPLCEPAYRMLMIASALSGNRSVIPRYLEQLDRRLQESYGLPADERTHALAERLLFGAPADASLWQDERLI